MTLMTYLVKEMMHDKPEAAQCLPLVRTTICPVEIHDTTAYIMADPHQCLTVVRRKSRLYTCVRDLQMCNRPVVGNVEAAKAVGLPKSKDINNKALEDAASDFSLTEEKLAP
ncbi:hypothetical protein TNCV_417422 [Trichonephila clavipes]|nr:hypothetical protein TNCV_417422 [Trichonephila clavipes]